MMTLRLCLCALGVASAAAAEPASIPHELLDMAFEFAEENEDRTYRMLVDDLEDGDVDALHLAATGMNATGASPSDALKIWHALADGTIKHAPAAYALGVHYDDDERHGGEGKDGRGAALKYFMQAADGIGDVRQPALHRAGRLLQEAKFVPKALDYYRRCAVQKNYVTAETTAACAEAHGALSDELTTVPGGILGYIEVFEKGSLDGFPTSSSVEGHMWKRAKRNLKLYSAELRDGVDAKTLENYRNAEGILAVAKKDLDELKKADGMSDMQKRMVDQILDIAGTMRETHEMPEKVMDRLGESSREQILDRLEEEAHDGGSDVLDRLEEAYEELQEELEEQELEELEELEKANDEL